MDWNSGRWIAKAKFTSCSSSRLGSPWPHQPAPASPSLLGKYNVCIALQPLSWSRVKKQPSPEPVFALSMAQCPGLVQSGSLHWELHAAGTCTRRKRCEMRASGRQIPNRCLFTSSRDHPKPLTLPAQAAQSMMSSQGIWLSTFHCDHRIITAFSANSTSSIADCLRCRSRQNKGEEIMWGPQPDAWRVRGENSSGWYQRAITSIKCNVSWDGVKTQLE